MGRIIEQYQQAAAQAEHVLGFPLDGAYAAKDIQRILSTDEAAHAFLTERPITNGIPRRMYAVFDKSGNTGYMDGPDRFTEMAAYLPGRGAYVQGMHEGRGVLFPIGIVPDNQGNVRVTVLKTPAIRDKSGNLIDDQAVLLSGVAQGDNPAIASHSAVTPGKEAGHTLTAIGAAYNPNLGKAVRTGADVPTVLRDQGVNIVSRVTATCSDQPPLLNFNDFQPATEVRTFNYATWPTSMAVLWPDKNNEALVRLDTPSALPFLQALAVEGVVTMGRTGAAIEYTQTII